MKRGGPARAGVVDGGRHTLPGHGPGFRGGRTVALRPRRRTPDASQRRARGGARVHAPARPLRVLPARRPVAVSTTSSGSAKRARHGRRRAHRPRQPVRRDRLLPRRPRSTGIKPILGVEAVRRPARHDRQASEPGSQLLPPGAAGQERESATRTCSSSSRRPTSRASTTSPRIDRELLAETREGLIALSACASGERPARHPRRTTSTQRARRPRGTARSSARRLLPRAAGPRHCRTSRRSDHAALVELAARAGHPARRDQRLHYATPEDCRRPGHPALHPDQQHGRGPEAHADAAATPST